MADGFTLGITSPEEAEATLKKLLDSVNTFGMVAQQCATCGQVCSEHTATLGLGPVIGNFMKDISGDLQNLVTAMEEGYNVLNSLVKGAHAGQDEALKDLKRTLNM